MDALGVDMDVKITAQSSIDLTPEALRSLPRAAGGAASSKGLSPASKVILSSKNKSRIP